MKLIGITGIKKSGKSTLAEMLLTALMPSDTRILSFADELKNEVARACCVPRGYIDIYKDNFRLILQGWGTNYRRELCGKDYWVERLLKQAIVCRNEGCQYLIIPDVRFRNEADAIKNVDGFLIRVNRPICITSIDIHPSETEQLSLTVDETVVNDSDLSKLKQAAKQIALKIK